MKGGRPVVSAEVHTTITHDVVLAVTGLSLGGLAVWAALFAFQTATPSDFDDMRGEIGLLAHIGPAGLQIPVAVMAMWMLCTGGGSLWRLMIRTPAIAANDRGLRFHPSIGPTLVEWSDVQSIRWIAKRPGEIEVRLVRRIWSFWNWTSSRVVRINHTALGLSWKQAAATVKAMKAEGPLSKASA
jgi:hypothetical protein